jgi:hypothetical protein
MANFYYLIEKLEKAEFISEPFDHLEIENFLSEEHFNIINSDSQIHFEEQSSHNQLRETLKSKSYKPIPFPGCTTNEDEYYELLNTNRLSEIKEANPESTIDGLGIAYNLVDIKNSFIKDLIEFLNSPIFQGTLRSKFGINNQTYITTRIQKYVTGYEISPHPDTRRKALTYLLNINKDDSAEGLDIHTGLLKFKDDYSFIADYWDKNPNKDRSWVRWDWCNIEKTISKNNSIVLFKPSNYSLHCVKLDYDHLPLQRTQIYGNLMFADQSGFGPGPNILDFEQMK